MFSWRNPFPARFGGRGRERVNDIYETIRSNVGTAFSSDPEAVNVLEDQAHARAICIAKRAIERRVLSVDPMKLTSPLLERYEEIYQVVPRSEATDLERRAALAARMTEPQDSNASIVSTLAANAFSPWPVYLVFTSNSSATKYWPGGSTPGSHFWDSTVAEIQVKYVAPTYATSEEIQTRSDACRAALDAYCAAWATFTITAG